jgi:hypothetical protein
MISFAVLAWVSGENMRGIRRGKSGDGTESRGDSGVRQASMYLARGPEVITLPLCNFAVRRVFAGNFI